MTIVEVLTIPLDSAIYGTDRIIGLWPHGTKYDNAYNTTIDAETFSHSFSADGISVLTRNQRNLYEITTSHSSGGHEIRKSQPKSRDFHDFEISYAL